MFIADYAGGFQTPYFDKKSANNSDYKNNKIQIQEQEHEELKIDNSRDTYGVNILEIMSDSEYNNFEKVTEYTNYSNKHEFAKSLEDITTDFLKKENLLNDDSEILKESYMKVGGMPTILEKQLDEYITKIKSLIGGNYDDLVQFINKYSNSLKYSPIDLQA